MKNLSIRTLIVVLVLCFTPLNAQVYIQQIQLGPKVGVNIAKLTDYDSKPGFACGIFFQFQISNLFAIQPEAYYTMKGATYPNHQLSDATLILNYIEVPVLIKLIIPIEGSIISPSVYAGPVISFNTTADFKSEENDRGLIEIWDISDDIQSTDFSLAFGGGMGFIVGSNELGFDVRYILGLKSVFDNSSEVDIKNSVINFNIFYGFSL